MDWLDPWNPEDDEETEENEEAYLPDLGSFEPASSIDSVLILSGGSPREVLARLVDGDPLGLAEMANDLLWESPFFLDPSRVLDRMVARIAYDADLFEPDTGLADFVRRRFQATIRDLCEEQLDEEHGSLPPTRSVDYEYYKAVAAACGVSLVKARRVCCALNALPAASRTAFYRVAMQGYRLKDVAEETRRPLEVAQSDVRAAILALASCLSRQEAKELRESLGGEGLP